MLVTRGDRVHRFGGEPAAEAVEIHPGLFQMRRMVINAEFSARPGERRADGTAPITGLTGRVYDLLKQIVTAATSRSCVYQ